MSINSKKVPFGQKVAFGIGMLANQMFPAILGIFMVVLVEDLKFSRDKTLYFLVNTIHDFFNHLVLCGYFRPKR